MDEPRWRGPVTPEKAMQLLGIACCALDKIHGWTEVDSDRYGDPGHFANAALDLIYDGGFKAVDTEGNTDAAERETPEQCQQ